jgi:hypothetical protein
VGEVLSAGASQEVTVGIVARGQADQTYLQAGFIKHLEERVGGSLAGLVFVLIESDVDTAVRVLAELGQLRRGQMGTDGAGAVAESCLPQHREIEQSFH